MGHFFGRALGLEFQLKLQPWWTPSDEIGWLHQIREF